jgi:photosystem II stability/assembly factor-like uncharacterized protein
VKKTENGFLLAVGKDANLSVYATDDAGVTWKSASVRQPVIREFAERCPAGDGRSFVFGLTADRATLTVSSVGGGLASVVPLVPAGRRVFAASCDDDALVAASVGESSRDVILHLCRHRSACTVLPPPRFQGVGALPQYPLDVARVDGVTVVAVTMGGIVRVASSRDDGQSWTPFAVAYDDAEHPSHHVDVRVPGRLLALGRRLLLHGGAPRPAQTYSLLVSDDYGASWRAPLSDARAATHASR